MLIGWGRTREMLLTAGNYDADEGAAMGFLETVCDVGQIDEIVENKIKLILSAGPIAVRAQKKLINAWEGLNPEDSIKLGIDYLAQAYETDEPQKMMAPLLNKTKK